MRRPASHTAAVSAEYIGAVRRFNRFYTRHIGVLGEGLLGSRFSLTEVRCLYELLHREEPTAARLARDLGIDPGYLSRILRRFRKEALLAAARSRHDGRENLLQLTPKGRKTIATLEARSNAQIATALAPLASADQRRLLAAMHVIEGLLGQDSEADAPLVIRPPEPGDLGWIVHRHGVLYAREHGYDEQFEALVASIVAEFVQKLDARRERCWIAERRGEIVGSVFVVRKSDDLAKLRLLLVEPSARGLGLGRRLVDECIRFARSRSYKTITLWTQSDLLPARRIYERAGFRLVNEQRHHSFGRDLVGETWELAL